MVNWNKEEIRKLIQKTGLGVDLLSDNELRYTVKNGNSYSVLRIITETPIKKFESFGYTEKEILDLIKYLAGIDKNKSDYLFTCAIKANNPISIDYIKILVDIGVVSENSLAVFVENQRKLPENYLKLFIEAKGFNSETLNFIFKYVNDISIDAIKLLIEYKAFNYDALNFAFKSGKKIPIDIINLLIENKLYDEKTLDFYLRYQDINDIKTLKLILDNCCKKLYGGEICTAVKYQKYINENILELLVTECNPTYIPDNKNTDALGVLLISKQTDINYKIVKKLISYGCDTDISMYKDVSKIELAKFNSNLSKYENWKEKRNYFLTQKITKKVSNEMIEEFIFRSGTIMANDEEPFTQALYLYNDYGINCGPQYLITKLAQIKPEELNNIGYDEKDRLSMIEYLGELKAYTKDSLIYAIKSQNPLSLDLVKVLIKAGDKPTIRDEDGWDALVYYCAYNKDPFNNEIIDLFIASGCKTNLDNCEKITKNIRSKFECMIENHSRWKEGKQL